MFEKVFHNIFEILFLWQFCRAVDLFCSFPAECISMMMVLCVNVSAM